MDFHYLAGISMPAIHDKTTAKVTKKKWDWQENH